MIAGLAVSSNFGPDLAALAATLVLGTALLGPLATHFADDLARLLHQRGATTAVQRRRPATLSVSYFAVSGPSAQVRARAAARFCPRPTPYL